MGTRIDADRNQHLLPEHVVRGMAHPWQRPFGRKDRYRDLRLPGDGNLLDFSCLLDAQEGQGGDFGERKSDRGGRR